MWMISMALVPGLAMLVSFVSPGERVVCSPASQWLLIFLSQAFAAQRSDKSSNKGITSKRLVALIVCEFACTYFFANLADYTLPGVQAACACGAAALALHFGGEAWASLGFLGIGTQERLILTQALVLSCWGLVSTCYDVLVSHRLPTEEAGQVQVAVTLLLGGCGALTACAVPLLAARHYRRKRAEERRLVPLRGKRRAPAAEGPSVSPTAAPASPLAAPPTKQPADEVPAASTAIAVGFYAVALLIIGGVEYCTLAVALGGREPVTWVLGDVVFGGGWGRGALFVWWGACLATVVFVSSTDRGSSALVTAWAAVSSRVLRLPSMPLPSSATLLLVRKAFHVLAVALFLPALLAPPASGAPLACLLALGLAVAFKLLLCAELARALGLPPQQLWGTQGLGGYMRRFTDARDDAKSSTFILTHLYLAAGCGVPLWCTLPLLTSPASGGLATTLIAVAAAAAGITALGLGDAAAAAVGVTLSAAGKARQWGRYRLTLKKSAKSSDRRPAEEDEGAPPAAWTKKTLEGSRAFVVAGTAGACVLLLAVALGTALTEGAGWAHITALAIACVVACAAHSVGSLLETFSDCIDNLIVPLSTLGVYLLYLWAFPGAASAAEEVAASA